MNCFSTWLRCVGRMSKYEILKLLYNQFIRQRTDIPLVVSECFWKNSEPSEWQPERNLFPQKSDLPGNAHFQCSHPALASGSTLGHGSTRRQPRCSGWSLGLLQTARVLGAASGLAPALGAHVGQGLPSPEASGLGRGSAARGDPPGTGSGEAAAPSMSFRGNLRTGLVPGLVLSYHCQACGFHVSRVSHAGE